jgi:hypothetical protein
LTAFYLKSVIRDGDVFWRISGLPPRFPRDYLRFAFLFGKLLCLREPFVWLRSTSEPFFLNQKNSFMKKILTLLWLASLASAAIAQTQKGSVMLGTSANAGLGTLLSLLAENRPGANNTSVGFGTEKYDGEKVSTSTTFGLAPNVGYFVANNLMLGVNFSISTTSNKDEGDDESYGNTLTTFQPMLRYYFNSAKVRPYGELRGGILNFKGRQEDEGDSATVFGLKGGAAIFLNEKVSLDLFLDYTMGFNNEEDEFTGEEIKNTSSLVSFGAGFSIFL